MYGLSQWIYINETMVNVMKKKMRKKKKHIQVIIPKTKKCLRCGKAVKNHHYFCDDCWAQKEKDKFEGRKSNEIHKFK